jgi:hypothetical protein
MTTAVLFDFKRQNCKLGPLPSLLAQSSAQIMGVAGPRVSSCANDLMGCLMGLAVRPSGSC